MTRAARRTPGTPARPPATREPAPRQAEEVIRQAATVAGIPGRLGPEAIGPARGPAPRARGPAAAIRPAETLVSHIASSRSPGRTQPGTSPQQPPALSRN